MSLVNRIFTLIIFNFAICKANNSIFHVPLNTDNSLNLHWLLNYPAKTVTFEVHLPPTRGWFAIGFSDRGDPFPADYCLLWNDLKGKIHFQDVWTCKKGIVYVDKQQDCYKFRIKSLKNVIKFTFKRKFDTCDYEDYVIEDGTTHIVWAKGDNALFKAAGLNISSSDDNSGMVSVNFNLLY